MYFKEHDKISEAEEVSTRLLNGSYSTESITSSTMASNPFKKLHQNLLSKEKNRKNKFKQWTKRLKFWEKDDNKKKKREQAPMLDEDDISTRSKRHELLITMI